MKKEDLNQLLRLKVPEATPKPEPGFLEVAGVQKKETVNSHVYAHFLNPFNNQDIANIFLEALLNMISVKGVEKELQLQHIKVYTEVSTSIGKRIDLVIIDESNKSVIIIENKVFAPFNNPLDNYWNHYDYCDQNKVGVYLTLEPEPSGNNNFINVTHKEWIDEVQRIGLPAKLSNSYYTYLNDFFRTIDNLTNSYEMDEQSKFYFENADLITKSLKTREAAYNFINGQLEILASRMGWQTHGITDRWRNIWDKENKLETCYTILFDRLLDGSNQLRIIIELKGKDVNKKDALDNLLKGSETPKKLKPGKDFGRFVHYKIAYYTLDLPQIENLADTIFNFIKNDFEATMVKILQHNYPGMPLNYPPEST